MPSGRKSKKTKSCWGEEWKEQHCSFLGFQRTRPLVSEPREKKAVKTSFWGRFHLPALSERCRQGGRGDVSHRSIEVRSGFYKKHGRTSIELELGLKFLVSSSVFSMQLFGSNSPYFTWIFSLFQKEQRFSNTKNGEARSKF